MGILHRAAHVALALILICTTLVASRSGAAAQTSTSLSGTVTADGKPVAGAIVTAIGASVTLHATTDANGAFRFNTLTAGEYTVSVVGPDGPVTTDVAVASGGATVALDLSRLQEIGHTATSYAPSSRASGTDFVISGDQIAHSAVGYSLPNILVQAPVAARGSNGQIHLNGDHNGIDYVVDGVALPEGLNRVLGNEIDPSTIGFGELIEGAYPAQYGDRFGGVFNISTKAKTGPAGFSLETGNGSYGESDNIVGYHTPLGSGGSFYAGARFERTNWALDPPVPNPVHDAGSIASQFARLTLPMGGEDTLTFDLTHALQTFQIPPDTSSGSPASTDDDEFQEDTFASLIYRHAFGQNGVLSFGPSYKRSRILDTNDPHNDVIGQISGPDAAPCTDFSNCSFFSVFADRTDINARFNADYDNTLGKHEIRAGALYGLETLGKDYVMTVPATTPDGSVLTPFTVTDVSPNVGHSQEFYLQDSWRMSGRWRADYGIRADSFQASSTAFDNGFAQWSPRVKLTYSFTPRSDIYGYYGRLFEPFSLESVSPAAAAALYGIAVTPAATNDLKPERDSLYELGGHLPVGAATLGWRISHRVATDWIDDTQVGATNLHQDINFPRGLVDLQSLEYDRPLANKGRFYLNVSHVVAQNSANCETQLLQNCAASGAPGGDLVQADHDQHYDVTTGIQVNDAHGGWFSFSGEYGSGLSLGDPTLCPPFPQGNAVNCKVPPHTTFDAAKGWALGAKTQLAVLIRNLLNDRYAITLDNALQGTHYAQPRTFELRLSLNT